jgi:glycosyltransferase involved in cell wall biosynthesis
MAVEALQLGRPRVMTAVGTIGEQLALDGIGGTAVAVGDSAAFATALHHYLDDPAAAMHAGAAGQTVGERYRASRLVAEVAAVYDEVAR